MKMMLYGAERYFLEIEAADVIKRIVPSAQSTNPMVYDCERITFSWDQLFEELITVSLFEPVKVIYCYNPTAALANLSDAQFKLFENILVNLPDEVVFFLMIESPTYDQRLKIFKLFTKEKQFKKVSPLDNNSFRKLILEVCASYNLRLQPNHLTMLEDRIPMQVPAVHQEIAKLASYPLPITEDIIKVLITRPMSDSVFELSGAIMQKDHRNAWKVYQDLLILKHDPVSLIPAIAWQYRVMFHILHYKAKKMTRAEIENELGEHRFTFQKAWDYANKTNKRSVMKLLDQLSVLDQSIKMGKTDKKMGFERFLLEAMR